MSELAIVSSREARLKAMAKSGSRGARAALALAADPGRFLSTVQIGITLIGILAGAYSGASLGMPVAQRIALLGIEPDTARTVGFGIVIVVTTFASLIIGELVPKQFALRSPEPIAAIIARPMGWLSKATAPFVWLLDQTSKLHFPAARAQPRIAECRDRRRTAPGRRRSADRRRARGKRAGDHLGHRPPRRPPGARGDDAAHRGRLDRHQLQPRADPRDVRRIDRTAGLPVAEGSVDNIVGVVQARDMLTALLEGREIDLRQLARKAPVIPDLMDAMDALAVLRGADVPLALVHDEYGHLDGIVTPGSILAALAGAFAHDMDDDDDPPLVERDDGSWLVSGAASADLLSDRLGVQPAARPRLCRPSPALPCRC